MQVFIVVNKGVVTEVIAQQPVKVVVIDRDTEGCGMVSVIEGTPADLQEPEVVVDRSRFLSLAVDTGKPLVSAHDLDDN